MEVNFTLFIQLGIYVAIILILRTLFFAPILELLRRREALTKGRLKESEDLLLSISKMREEYSAKLEAVRVDLTGVRVSSLTTVREDADKKISAAKKSASDRIIKGTADLGKEFESVRSKVSQASADVAKEIVKAIMSARVVRF